jgi:hypothetical protein
MIPSRTNGQAGLFGIERKTQGRLRQARRSPAGPVRRLRLWFMRSQNALTAIWGLRFRGARVGGALAGGDHAQLTPRRSQGAAAATTQRSPAARPAAGQARAFRGDRSGRPSSGEGAARSGQHLPKPVHGLDRGAGVYDTIADQPSTRYESPVTNEKYITRPLGVRKVVNLTFLASGPECSRSGSLP